MEEEINLMDYARVILRRKKLVLGLVSLFTLGSVVYSLVLKNQYRAVVTLLPLGGGANSKLFALVAQMGMTTLSGGGNSSIAQLQVLLRSQTLAEQVIKENQLVKVFFRDFWDEAGSRWKTDDPKKVPTLGSAVQTLFSIVSFPESDGVTLKIVAIHEDPKFAAELANTYVKTIANYINENALTSAKRNRIFIEGQLERNKRELLESGKELSNFYVSNKISNVVPTVDVDISNVGAEPADTAVTGDVREGPATLPDPSDSAASGVPGISTAFAEVGKQVQDLQTKTQAIHQKLEEAKKIKNVPHQIYLQYLTLHREMLGQVNTLLAQQLEMAKIEESKEDLNFQVVDWARIPEQRFKPNRRQIVMVTFATAMLLAVFFVFFMEYLKKMGESSKLKIGNSKQIPANL